MEAVSVENLTKSFGSHKVLDRLSFQVEDGHDLRLYRAQRLGQDDYHPHSLGPPKEGWRPGPGAGRRCGVRKGVPSKSPDCVPAARPGLSEAHRP